MLDAEVWPVANSETAEFALTAIPWDELAFASTADGLRDYMAGLLHPVAR